MAKNTINPRTGKPYQHRDELDKTTVSELPECIDELDSQKLCNKDKPWIDIVNSSTLVNALNAMGIKPTVPETVLNNPRTLDECLMFLTVRPQWPIPNAPPNIRCRDMVIRIMAFVKERCAQCFQKVEKTYSWYEENCSSNTTVRIPLTNRTLFCKRCWNKMPKTESHDVSGFYQLEKTRVFFKDLLDCNDLSFVHYFGYREHFYLEYQHMNADLHDSEDESRPEPRVVLPICWEPSLPRRTRKWSKRYKPYDYCTLKTRPKTYQRRV
jgi:hypothetical protein